MCGIAGFVGGGDKQSLPSLSEGKKTLTKMLDAISHRGPDDRGTFIQGEVGLGFNRLSIIDLSSKGHQPMFDSEKSVCIVLNGEIYNFQDLKSQLEKKYLFKSKTDTEVLLYAYKEWGIGCLSKINGMFSFVIYDVKKNLFFGARDRLGEKPLKYYWDGQKFAFASEIKGLLPYLGTKPEIDPIAINHYLTLQYVPSPLTGFRKIFKLPPGCFFIYKNRKLKIKKYWQPDFSKKLILSEREWEQTLFKQLQRSVQSRMVADVPIGAFLSGGIDSSAVVALMSELGIKPIKTFTISFEDPKFDESEYASLVARKLKTDHRSLRVTNKMMGDIFAKLAYYYDEPFADNSVIPTIILSRLAGQYVKVALTGDGGDENFAGYERYNVVKFSELYTKIPLLGRKLLQRGAHIANFTVGSKLTARAVTFANTFEHPFYSKYLYYSGFFDNETKNYLYTKEFKKEVKSDTFTLPKSFHDKKLSVLDNALMFDILNYLPEDLLFKTDIASMAFSLETRAPLLDHELVELAARMPSNLKIKLFDKKYLFKKVLEKNQLLPKEITRRRKKGFVAPIDQWLKQEFKDFTITMLRSQKFKEANIFDQVKLENYLQKFFEGQPISANNIFALLVLALWVNEYF